MVHKLTITVPDDAFASLQSAAASASRTPEELAAEAVVERFKEQATRHPMTELEAREAVLAIMRSRGHLVEQPAYPQMPEERALPPEGSPERLALEESIATEFGDALIRSGLSVLDLIERR